MISSLLGTKHHMEQGFTIAGHRVPITVVKTGPNLVTQVKTLEKDGYSAVQLGYGTKKAKHTTKPLQNHFAPSLKASEAHAKNQDQFPRYTREAHTDETFELGTKINPAEILKAGDLVAVTGVSKGKGFAGGVKRWGFAGGPKTHGQSDRHRAPGSIGQGTDPGRVHKGKKMAGRMGGAQTTVANITVLKVDEKTNQVWLSGPVPGANGGLLSLQKVGEDKKFQQLLTDDVSEEVIEQAMEQAAAEEAANAPVVEVESSESSESSDQGNQENKSETPEVKEEKKEEKE